MGYNYRSPNYRRYRRGIYGFPWGIIFFVIVLTNSWSFTGIAQWILGAVLLSFLINILLRFFAKGNSTYPQQQPYYQPTYQQPSQTAQSSYTPSSQVYEKGYQAAVPVYHAGEPYQPSREQATSDTYQEYEQPKAEYPEQMPPM